MLIAAAVCALCPVVGAAPLPVLEHSDVVSMYGAGVDVYREYGVTLLAWGGTPSEESLASAREAGVVYFGSVGMVTEFARFIDEFPEYESAICIDVEGNRLRVPWLWDHEHNGVPAYWFCTNQPVFREYLRRRVAETVAKGADGVHIDDHLGTAGNAWLGGCYCDQCMEGFRAYAAERVPAEELAAAGVTDVAALDYRALVLEYLAQHPDAKDRRWEWPLASHFAAFESLAAADFMLELRALAAETAGRPVPMSENAGVPHIAHLTDYTAVDFLSCEVGQGGESREPGDGVAFAYRIADAIDRPVAATASGQDWAMIAEEKREALVRVWIAQAYTYGHFFMTPHHQWCYTEEKGTHWYDGPPEEYAWVYRFVRDHADLFDGYAMAAPVGVWVSAADYRLWKDEPQEMAAELARANAPFRVVLGGDALLDPGTFERDLAACRVLLAAPSHLPTEEQADAIEAARDVNGLQVVKTVAEALEDPHLAIDVQGAHNVWALPRVRTQGNGPPAVIHLVNRFYQTETDEVAPQACALRFAAELVGLNAVRSATLHQPNAQPVDLDVSMEGEWAVVEVPSFGFWGIVELRGD